MNQKITLPTGGKSQIDAAFLFVLSVFIFETASRTAEIDSYFRLLTFVQALIFAAMLIIAHRFMFTKINMDNDRVWNTYVLSIVVFNRSIRFDEIEKFYLGPISRGFSDHLLVRTKSGKQTSILFSNKKIQDAFKTKAQELGLQEVDRRIQLW